MSADARTIYGTALDALTGALLARDVETFGKYVMLPHQVSTVDGRLVFRTPLELEEGVLEYRRSLDAMGVTSLRRVCTSARAAEEDILVGYHLTELRTETDPQPPVYATKAVFHRVDGGWRMLRSDSAVSLADWPGMPHARLSRFSAGPLSRDDADGLRKATLQTLLDKADHALLYGDYDGWRTAFSLPFTFESRTGTEVYATEDGLRGQFDAYRKQFLLRQVTDVVRVVTTTHLIGEDQMVASYKAYVLHKGINLIPSWESGVTLRREAGMWRLTKIMRPDGRLKWTNRMHQPMPGAAPDGACDMTNTHTDQSRPDFQGETQ